MCCHSNPYQIVVNDGKVNEGLNSNRKTVFFHFVMKTFRHQKSTRMNYKISMIR